MGMCAFRDSLSNVFNKYNMVVGYFTLRSQLRSSGPLYLSIIHKPVSDSLWYKNVPMGQHTRNSIMKRMIGNSLLRNSDKKLTNHSARKTLIKKLRQNYIPKSEIIDVAGHNSEAGLNAYDIGNEEQERAISNAIDAVNKDPMHFQRSHSKPWVILPNVERVNNPTFNFLDQKWAFPKSANCHFHNCTVNF